MLVDLSLIHQAQSRANGANIHAVANMILRYRSAAWECEHGVDGAADQRVRAESRLRLFVETGQLEG